MIWNCRSWTNFRCVSPSDGKNANWTNVGRTLLLYASVSRLKQSSMKSNQTTDFRWSTSLWIFLLSVCHRWSGRYVNSRRFPKLDKTQTRLPRTVSADRMRHFILFWFAESDTGRHIFLPTDRPLCGLDIDHVPGIFPNDCNHMVLWCAPFVENHQTNDGKGTITLFPIVLAGHWTTSVDRKYFAIFCCVKIKKFHWTFFGRVYGFLVWSTINLHPSTMDHIRIQDGLMDLVGRLQLHLWCAYPHMQ